MASSINLFQHPENLLVVQDLVFNLEMQCKLVGTFEQTASSLHKTVPSSTLHKCNHFIDYVEKIDEKSAIFSEISSLTLDELVFISMCFTSRTFHILDHLKMAHVRMYLKSKGITRLAEMRREITKRLDFISGRNHPKFRNIYERLVQPRAQGDEEEEQKQLFAFRDGPEPSAPKGTVDDFTLNVAYCPSASAMFGDDILQELPTHDEVTPNIRTWVPRLSGDAFISIDLPMEGSWLKSIFPGLVGKAHLPSLRERWPKVMADSERTDLRKWEVLNGYHDYTNCVQLHFVVKIRVPRFSGLVNYLHRDPSAHASL